MRARKLQLLINLFFYPTGAMYITYRRSRGAIGYSIIHINLNIDSYFRQMRFKLTRISVNGSSKVGSFAFVSFT